jgi:polyhydroxybutyrate depolymerase
LPQGTGRSWWNPDDSNDRLRDYSLFDAILSEYTSLYCVDLDRIYVVGHSLGATFANSLACARGDKIRAAGTLGGGVIASRCRGEIAAVVLHNPEDRLVDITEGIRVRDLYLNANRLDVNSVPAEPSDFNCLRYGAPAASHPVLWCPHTKSYSSSGKYYPHTWPRGTGKVVMEFFTSLP